MQWFSKGTRPVKSYSLVFVRVKSKAFYKCIYYCPICKTRNAGMQSRRWERSKCIDRRDCSFLTFGILCETTAFYFPESTSQRNYLEKWSRKAVTDSELELVYALFSSEKFRSIFHLCGSEVPLVHDRGRQKLMQILIKGGYHMSVHCIIV